MAKILMMLAALVAMCAAQQANVNCPQTNGPVADPNDCSFFFQCDNGQGTRKACVSGLEFNPQINQCDFPANMPNPQCQRGISQGSQINAPCNGMPNTALVQHPNFCNAFMRCGMGYLYDGCSFCSSGEYFNVASQRCMSTYNVDTNRECNGKEMVLPVDQELRRLEGSCYPHNPTLFTVLIEKIRREQGNGGGFRPVNVVNNNNG